MNTASKRRQARIKRKNRIRKKLSGTPAQPRLSVFRSARHIYAQVIDDLSGNTLAAASSLETALKEKKDLDDKQAVAKYVGKLLGERAMGTGVKTVVFDRNGFLYHGRVKAVSDGAREAGLKF